MPLVPAFRAAAVARGLFPDDQPMTPEAAYALVRDMPYRRASSRTPETTIEEWRGTCSGKHYLLRALLEGLGMATMLIVCTHEFTRENSPWLPDDILGEIERHGPVPDVHNFLRVQAEPEDDWTTVDATWPLAARDLGLPANEAFVRGVDQRLAADPIEVFHVPDDADPQTFKEQLIEDHAGAQAERRDRVIERLTQWLGEVLPG
ncbi:MAG: hypothetical protein GEU80_01125 [Dehalococcoidia bacterium]|nr:hypothetical protein [Dehalococcoidia bacterium]